MSWTIDTKCIKPGLNIAIIDLKFIDKNMKNLIDNLIISICHGKNSIDYDLKYVKSKLYSDLTNNGVVTSDVKRGAIAEFFIHLFLNSINYKQECFFLNLEEPKSIKKGFDGFYSLNDEEWIMESKSGLSSTANISHKNKVIEAHSDLIKKFSSNPVENDPWRNAIMHAGNEDLSTSENIKSRLRKCAKLFSQNQAIDMSNYNIVPSSTIYIIDNSYTIPKNQDLFLEIESKITNMSYKQILVICVTQHSLSIFTDYLIQ